MEEIRYEKDMYEPVRDYLSGLGFSVRSEVNKCDIVAKREDYVVIVEMKRHLSFDLLEQAIERQAYADAVYACIPKPTEFTEDKKWRSKLKVLRRLGLGLLLLSKTDALFMVEEALAPEQTGGAPRTSARKRKALTGEFDNRALDLNTGGCHAVPLVTAYREAALYLVYLLDFSGPLLPKEIKKLGGHPKKTTPILNANYYKWFSKMPDGRYCLTDSGHEAMMMYAPLIEVFRGRALTTPDN